MSKGKPLFEMGAKIGNGWSYDNGKAPAKPKEILLPEKHLLVFRFEKRKGKPVTLIGPFALSKEDLQDTAKAIKKKIAAGGGIEEEWLAFQGDWREKLRPVVESLGFRFKNK